MNDRSKRAVHLRILSGSVTLGAGLTSLIYACTPNFDLLIGNAGSAGADSMSGSDAGGSDACANSECAGSPGSGRPGSGGRTGAGGAPTSGGASNTGGSSAGKGGAVGNGGAVGKAGSGAEGGLTSGGTTGGGGSSGGGSSGMVEVGGRIEPGLPGTATADSEEAGVGKNHPASFANDGDPTTRWSAADGGLGHSWTLALTQSQVLTRIEIMWEYPPQATGGPYRYTVSVSDDNVTYNTPAIDKSATTETTQTQVSLFPNATSGRFVRIQVVGLPPFSGIFSAMGGSETWAGIYEVRVYGP